MAFNKDPQGLVGIPAFGGSLQQRQSMMQKNRPARGARGRRFSDEIKPPMAPQIMTGRIIPGAYATTFAYGKDAALMTQQFEWWQFVEHFDGRTNKSCICSAGPFREYKGRRDPCTGCDLFFLPSEKGADGKKNKRMSARQMYVFSFLDFQNYHKVISMEDGRPRTGNNGEAFFDWVPCEGRTCPHCHTAKETVSGRVRPWVMGETHFSALVHGYGGFIGKSCAACGGRDTIQSLAWLCPHCGDAIIDMATTRFSDAEISKMVLDVMRCPNPSCAQLAIPNEIIKCGACPNGQRSTIFDVDINASRQGTGEGSQTALTISTWSNPQRIDPRFAAIAKALPLDKMYLPTPVEEQNKKFGMTAEGPVQNQGFRAYGQQPPPQGFTPPQQQQQFAPYPQQQQFAPQYPPQQGGYAPTAAVPGAYPPPQPQPQQPYYPPQGFPPGFTPNNGNG